MTMPNEIQYDVFLSHCAKDKATAHSSSQTLTDQPDCTPGDSLRAYLAGVAQRRGPPKKTLALGQIGATIRP